jgi:hypothetical protein
LSNFSAVFLAVFQLFPAAFSAVFLYQNCHMSISSLSQRVNKGGVTLYIAKSSIMINWFFSIECDFLKTTINSHVLVFCMNLV